MNLLEPFDYLRWLFTELPKGQRSLEELMPWSVDEETINIR
ncbi:MAG: transposase domain-containing protein [Aliivibrio sp.]|nr:transposase domain-containing protein [Aliivibrio sp.]